MNQCKVKIGSAYDPRKAPKIYGDAYKLQGVLIQSDRASHADKMDRFIFRVCCFLLAILAVCMYLAIV